MNKNTEKFIENKKMFRCPLCKGKLSVRTGGSEGGNSSFLCKKKHCFDLAAKGYVNLITGQGSHPNKYDRNLFECRNRIFGDGFYEPVLEELLRTMEDYGPTQKRAPEGEASDQEEMAMTVLDVGCGEGFYASWLDKRCSRANVFGLDIVKEAIQIACRQQSDVKWIVGNLADIPLFNGTFDVLLNVLTPANYKEFCRLLKKEGVLIKVVPGRDYLLQVRQCVSDQLINKSYTNDLTVDYFMENMELLEKRSVHYTMPVTEEQAKLFLQMTPMTFHIDTAELPPEKLRQIQEMTIHLEFLVGRARQV